MPIRQNWFEGWRLFAVLALPYAWSQRRWPEIRFLLAWIVPAWLVFEAVPTKLPHYTLPLYPALCLLGAAALVRAVHGPRWLAMGLPALVGGTLAVAAAAVPLALGGPPFIPGLLLVAADQVGDQPAAGLRHR